MDFLSVVKHHENLMRSLKAAAPDVERAASALSETISTGNKILICGNGGSAADAQHFAAELVGRFETARKGLPAISLTTDTSIITALANDFGYVSVFARQVEAHARPGDALIAISTSGYSENILAAVRAAKEAGMVTIGLMGSENCPLWGLVDCAVCVSGSTARVQEYHGIILHYFAHKIEGSLE